VIKGLHIVTSPSLRAKRSNLIINALCLSFRARRGIS